jgi:uncharacterized membrane protein YozB (DUF420 family)
VDLSFLPTVNATLNAIAAALLVIGFCLIKKKRVDAHRRVMLGAFAASCLFLLTYVTHYVWRAQVAGGSHTKFNGEGPVRTLYYAMLISHIMLAVTVPVMAVLLIRFGLTGRYTAHRRLAKFAWPIWMYVSITGVLIYLILYHWNPPPQLPPQPPPQ